MSLNVLATVSLRTCSAAAAAAAALQIYSIKTKYSNITIPITMPITPRVINLKFFKLSVQWNVAGESPA